MPSCVDDEPADRLGVAQLPQQLLPDDQQPLTRARAAAAVVGTAALLATASSDRGRQVALQTVGQQLELILFPLLQLLADEHRALGNATSVNPPARTSTECRVSP
jgi:hypothetical protein